LRLAETWAVAPLAARGGRARSRVGAAMGSRSAARAIGVTLFTSGYLTRLAETWAVAPLAGAGRLGAPLATGGPALGFGYLLGGGVG